jgi:hypothetical protein
MSLSRPAKAISPAAPVATVFPIISGDPDHKANWYVVVGFVDGGIEVCMVEWLDWPEGDIQLFGTSE